MKKETPFIIALLFITTTALSQRFSFGVRGGLNVANVSMTLPAGLWPAANQKESRISFNAGVYGRYFLSGKTSLQAELFYSGEGANFTDPGTELPAHLKLNYLSLPVFFKYTIVKNIYVMAGPQFSYLLAAKSIYKNGNPHDIKDQQNKINIAIVPVIGYDWKNISISLRYQVGLSKLPKALPYWSNTPYADGDAKSNVFSVVVSYKIFDCER